LSAGNGALLDGGEAASMAGLNCTQVYCCRGVHCLSDSKNVYHLLRLELTNLVGYSWTGTHVMKERRKELVTKKKIAIGL